MTKSKSIFACTNCGTQFPAWQGRCTECGSWGTVVEETTERTKTKPTGNTRVPDAVPLSSVRGVDAEHRPTGIAEFDRVLSGGLVPGSLTLLGGSPGIGKSTLVMQVAAAVASAGTVAYISGEESKEQLKLRADRLKIKTNAIVVITETDIDAIVAYCSAQTSALVIVDSIQTVASSEIPGEAGSIQQIKGCTVRLLEAAKKTATPILLVGHVTKEGVVAGPRTLEHLVDTVLYLEGDGTETFRLLRTVKHRFGITDEVGVFAMTNIGLESVANPSELFLAKDNRASGTAVTAILEGTRAFLIDVQALVTPTAFGFPRRLANGIETNRLELLVAVLARRAGLNLATFDIHLNCVGGLKVRERAIDLALCAAIASGKNDAPLDRDTVYIGEVGLGGEVRPVPRLEQRLKEASQRGFRVAFVPKQTLSTSPKGLTLRQVTTVQEALSTK